MSFTVEGAGAIPAAQENNTAQTSMTYGQMLWRAIDQSKSLALGVVVLAGSVTEASAQPLQELGNALGTWTLPCCVQSDQYNVMLCRTITMPFNNATITNIIVPFESVTQYGNSYCALYDRLIAHGPDFATFVYSTSSVSATIISTAAAIASVALTQLL